MSPSPLPTNASARRRFDEDERFSARYARVVVAGRERTIEEHYQLSKRWFDAPPATTWPEGYGRAPDYFVIGGRFFHASVATEFVCALWCRYLDRTPDLAAYLRQFGYVPGPSDAPEDRLHDEALARYARGKRSLFPLP